MSGDDELSTQIERMRATVKDVREQRLALERQSEDEQVLNAALNAVEREIDAATSPELRQLQDQITTLEHQGHQCDVHIDRIISFAREPRRGKVDLRVVAPALWERLNRLLDHYRTTYSTGGMANGSR